jgi:hypothetical protein
MAGIQPFKFIGVVILLFGIIITCYGFSFLFQKNELQANGIVVKGTVVDIAEKAIYRSPIVKFITKEGKTINFKSRLEVNKDLFKYKVGQEVEVIYNKNDPEDVEINAFWEQNMPQIFLGAFGLFLLLLGVFLFLKGIRKSAQISAP